MSNGFRAWLTRATLLLIILPCLFMMNSSAFAGKAFDGQWSVNITIPESPTSNKNQTFTVNFDASPRASSLHGRMTITDQEDRTVGGVWRQVGKKVYVTYELPCTGEGPCASLVMKGKIKNQNTQLKKGKVIVMWDTPNEQNTALYDTSNGKFNGDRLQ
ncbi:MAG: hypothetical protein L0229_27455 [Blastocatellia bacterium]|nr:hypothetical protein [Blastocatellia bacterium]